MGRGDQEGFVLSFPQVDNNLGKALLRFSEKCEL